jgi:hypothetical protein
LSGTHQNNNQLKRVESFKHQDAKDYYGFGHDDSEQARKKTKTKHDEDENDARGMVVAECYIGLSKLLNDEMKAFDLKDSVFLDTMKAPVERKESVRNLLGSGSFMEKL